MSQFLILKHNPATDQFVAVAKVEADTSIEAIEKIKEPGRFDVLGIFWEQRVRIAPKSGWDVEYVPESEA